jgi:hypothetical protein
MPRRPAQIAQSDVARIIRAAKQAGASEVVVKVGKRPNLQIPQFVDIATAEESLAAYLASVESAINQHKPTTLYRHFDKDRRLLYAGLSRDVWRRQADHRNKSHCFDRVVRVETEHFPNHNDALAAELEATRNEKPECNVAGRVAV